MLTSRQIFRYAVPARTVTRKALSISPFTCYRMYKLRSANIISVGLYSSMSTHVNFRIVSMYTLPIMHVTALWLFSTLNTYIGTTQCMRTLKLHMWTLKLQLQSVALIQTSKNKETKHQKHTCVNFDIIWICKRTTTTIMPIRLLTLTNISKHRTFWTRGDNN